MSPLIHRRTRASTPKLVMLGFAALLAWLGVGLDLYVHMEVVAHARPPVVFAAVFDFLAYFTVLSNLLVGLILTSALRRWNHSSRGVLLHPVTTGAALVYILLVALLYNTILRFQWQPIGLHRLSDELMHSLVPILYVAYWTTQAPRLKLSWRTAIIWTVPPLVYGGLLLVRAQATGVQPYPFLATDEGAATVVRNVVAIALLIVFLGLAVIAAGRALAKTTEATTISSV